jgi:hypothetical protein
MRERLDKCEHLYNKSAPTDSFNIPMNVLYNGFLEEAKLHDQDYSFLGELKNHQFTPKTAAIIRSTLDSLKEFYIDQFNSANEKKEMLISRMTDTPQKNELFNEMKNRYENESLEDMVRSNNQTDRLVVTKEKIIQRFEPVFHQNNSEKFFQAPLFSAFKNIGDERIPTAPANMIVIWGMTIILYFTLQINLFRKIIGLFGR